MGTYVCAGVIFTRERVDRIKLEADPLMWNLERRDANLGEVGLQVSGNLQPLRV